MPAPNTPFVKYGSIPEIGSFRELKISPENHHYIFEKIDGGNCQVRKINGRLYAGSKSNFLTGPVIEKSEWFGKLLGWMYPNSSLFSLPENVILFGEWSGNHTIDYRKNNDKFFLIDVFRMKGGTRTTR